MYWILVRRSAFTLAVLALTATLAPAVASAVKVPKPPSGCRSSLRYRANVPPQCEQWRYVMETMKYHPDQYMARANDFRSQGCSTPGGGCRKPAPYNGFDWTTDGCSWTPPPARNVFNSACQQHDFGYRNFGKGPTVGRNEDARAWVDWRFKTEMTKLCKKPAVSIPLGGKILCNGVATGMYGVVRNRSDWSD